IRAASPAHPLPVHQHSLRQGHTHEGIHRRGSFSGLPGIRQREVSRASPKFANEVGGTPLQTCCIGRVPLQREACGKGEEACPQKRTRPSSAVGSRVRLGRRGSRCPSKSVAGRGPSRRGRTWQGLRASWKPPNASSSPGAVARPNSRWPGHSPKQGRASPRRWKRSVRRWASKTPGTTMDRSSSGSRFYSPKLEEGCFCELRPEGGSTKFQKRRRLCTGAPLGALRCSEVRTSSKGRAPKEDRHQGSSKERRAAAASGH